MKEGNLVTLQQHFLAGTALSCCTRVEDDLYVGSYMYTADDDVHEVCRRHYTHLCVLLQNTKRNSWHWCSNGSPEPSLKRGSGTIDLSECDQPNTTSSMLVLQRLVMLIVDVSVAQSQYS